MKLSDNARAVLERRYLKKQEGKVVEEPEDLLRRVAQHVAAVEAEAFHLPEAEVAALAEAYYRVMDEKKFMPNSPTLMNAGRELGQLSACFVLPIEDSMESIFESLKIAALIHKSGGGTGFSFSRIRPQNDQVGSTGGVASGPLSFLKVYNASTEAVKQGGTRRGANMGILRIDHPDILEFIDAKKNRGELTNFNLSVAVTDRFMEALDKDESYFLVNPRSRQPVGKLPAREVFEKIVRSAWENGEPGVVFIDRMNEANPTPNQGAIESTNPCGEQPLLPFESCNLGSLNLSQLVKACDGRFEVDWDELAAVTRLAIRFLDDVIEVNQYPIPQIEQITKGNRKIGLGVMGWADLLFKLRIPYNSEQAIQLAETVMNRIDMESKQASAALAEERGTFPNFTGSVYENKLKLRNATTTTIAPTGTISIICDTSGGIEPLFSLAFVRQIMDNDRLIEVNHAFAEIAKAEGFFSQELLEKLAETGSAADLPEIPEEWRKVFITAHEIDPEWHIRMQAAFQKYTDNAVSKTINFAHDATPEQVAEAYRLAYKLGCKGLTVYRDGSIDNQPMQKGLETKTVTDSASNPETRLTYGEWGQIQPIKRPKRLNGITDARQTPEGNLYLTLNFHERQPFELFAQIGKAGSDLSAFTEAIARLISLAFRCGIDPQAVAEELLGIGGSRFVGFGPNRVRSVPDAIGQFLSEYLAKMNETAETAAVQPQLDLGLIESAPTVSEGIKPPRPSHGKMGFNLCPVCGMYTFGYFEGCAKCISCGHSEC
ncbi:ribonucleoside-diphosphate reductase class II [Hydrogenispora ethanolica]|jgi:ribonucleoside-diphosphate reductase alpha chain|uniref:Vitamin B12-dependent ribonucleotide reductase n=1 Tax=Hydrogenispora ethanolica TaxID=1082276 RepID=A0A4R1RTD2_HYDET|nr:vitamin B12-dependent ribonucleotide reductase [Hydrogenispora ethanolica]TCL69320.1 ribonucleoside-diphosphate reductase class II [Hydrogenispora ethanolica]